MIDLVEIYESIVTRADVYSNSVSTLHIDSPTLEETIKILEILGDKKS